ncbi:hypothetical protein R1sor_010962 [Riccia sorocarpa]|uniref:Aminopeptidase n=1 Tax=Riccia sorocarpa TaxID=122646 RepID=A0ABD3I0X8_9MARC
MAGRAAATAILALGASYVILKQLKNKRRSRSSFVLKDSMRLPRFAEPHRYDIELMPNLDTCKFDGKVAIRLEILESTDHIVLNAADLNIYEKSVSLRTSATRQVLWPTRIELVKEDELLILTFEDTLPLGNALLSMDFQGTLNDQMKGFYRSTYTVGGVNKNMATTQFEPADARRCFPCWDEPAYKATFKLTVHVPLDRVVLSNMPVNSEAVNGAKRSVFFEESPKMSTYLVAVVVGEFDFIESTTENGKVVRVYTEVGKKEQGKFALEVALKTLPFYTKYFGTAYPLPKLDMIAIPDFAAGAMENYGLVTYREATLLIDEIHSTAANKQRVAIVVAHELAHMWFGNLVTMEWWTHLWLNEGFATWVSYLAVDYLFPEWGIWTQFVDQTVEAFRLDGLIESHPIEVEVGHVREIDEIFDAISYKKGASIIRMLQTYLTPDVFQKGLSEYIKRFAYKNAATEDLWAVLSEVSGEPVEELMHSWTSQKGFPVITAKVHGKATSVELKQSQFLSSGVDGKGEWVVPVTVAVGSYKVTGSYLARGKISTIELPAASSESPESDSEVPSWIKLNIGQTGFYRVQYDEELAKRLRSAIASNSIEPTDRFGILEDTYALSAACKQPLSVLLSLMEVFQKECDYTVLSCLIDVSYRVHQVVNDALPAAAPDTKKFISSLFQTAAKKLGWDPIPGESHLEAMLRGEVLSALVSFGDEDAIAEAKRRFRAYVDDRRTSLFPADIRVAGYKAVIHDSKGSDRFGYDSLLRLYRESDLSQEKNRILGTVAASSDPLMVREALDFLLSPEVRSQDTIWILSGIGLEGREASWTWLSENWDTIWGRYGETTPLIARFISRIVSQFTSYEKADEIEAFFATNAPPALDRTVSQSIERVRIMAQWVKHVHQESDLVDLLKKLASGGEESSDLSRE